MNKRQEIEGNLDAAVGVVLGVVGGAFLFALTATFAGLWVRLMMWVAGY